MTTELDSNDPRVTGAYRDLAGEKTPAELDRKVLAMAAAEARTRYGLTRFWIRPVAWAATIGLSLALILEISQYAGAPIIQPDSDADVLIEDRVRDEGHAGSDLQKRSDEPQPLRVVAPPAAEKAGREPASPAESRAISRDAEAGEVSLMREADDMSLLREAEEQARMRAGDALPAAASAVAPRKEQYRYCEDATRSSAESWYDCIEELRAQGLTEAARLELEALKEAFPEFREPARQ